MQTGKKVPLPCPIWDKDAISSLDNSFQKEACLHTQKAHMEEEGRECCYAPLHSFQPRQFLFQCLHTDVGVQVPTLWLLPLKSRKQLIALQLLPALSKFVAAERIHFSHENCDISGESSICNCWNIIYSDCICFKHQKPKPYFLCTCFSHETPNAVELFSVSISCLSHFPPYMFFSI